MTFALIMVGMSLGNPLMELMPVPVKVEVVEKGLPQRRRDAEKVEGVEPVVVVAPVEGAPSDTADEAYQLDITPTGTVITASGRRGVIWAKTTIGQLAKLGDGRIPCCRIVDWPKFRWRGFMPDCGRNYIEVRHVKGMIDAMSANKINLLHWHLTEYYGWRLESKRYPELQRTDAFYLRHIGKYYTQEEFREIVDYAWERGVTVMPEFDVPGHALAFRRAFGFKTMRDEGVRERLCGLIDELCSLVPAEKMPFVHLGTDEARLPEEKVPPLWLEPMVKRVQESGRTVVGWMPGELKGLEASGRIAGMRWGRRKVEALAMPCFDATGMYLDTMDPFELLGVAAFRKVCDWPESEGARLGGVVCAWHDDAARDGYDFMRNQAVMPAYTLFGDAFWRGREDAPAGSGRWMPKPGTAPHAQAEELERRVIAQRDKVWKDSPYPYHFLRQTDLRWRVTDGETDRVVARDLAQATVFLWQACNDGVEGGGHDELGVGNVFTNRSGTAVLETWIRSPVTQRIGAWIGFTDYVRNHGRAYSAPTPERGKWNRTGATVELNGELVPPPDWRKPGQLAGADVTHLLYVHELDEIPFEDEEYYMRPPTPIMLRQGWNHVKLTVPCQKAARYAPWVATFIPMLGTTEHPREVPGLEYASEPHSH